MAALAWLAAASEAHAGVEAWRVNEVAADPADPALRWVELYAAPSPTADNCFFPGTRLEILDGAGGVVGIVQPFNVTTCYGGDTYFLFATTEASAATGKPADAALPVAIDPAGGQVCLRSGVIRYDCARWGAVSVPVHDQLGAGDDSVAAPGGLPSGQALERRMDTDVVADDFVLDGPTPRGPNDGTPWTPPDAGPDAGSSDGGPDGGPGEDAAPADADVEPDARPVIPGPDARSEPPVWIHADPGGGGCSAGGGAGGLYLLGLVALVSALRAAVAARSRRRSSQAPMPPATSTRDE